MLKDDSSRQIIVGGDFHSFTVKVSSSGNGEEQREFYLIFFFITKGTTGGKEEEEKGEREGKNGFLFIM